MEPKSLDHQIIEKFLDLLSTNEIDKELTNELSKHFRENTNPDYRQYKNIIEAYLNRVENED